MREHVEITLGVHPGVHNRIPTSDPNHVVENLGTSH